MAQKCSMKVEEMMDEISGDQTSETTRSEEVASTTSDPRPEAVHKEPERAEKAQESNAPKSLDQVALEHAEKVRQLREQLMKQKRLEKAQENAAPKPPEQEEGKHSENAQENVAITPGEQQETRGNEYGALLQIFADKKKSQEDSIQQVAQECSENDQKNVAQKDPGQQPVEKSTETMQTKLAQAQELSEKVEVDSEPKVAKEGSEKTQQSVEQRNSEQQALLGSFWGALGSLGEGLGDSLEVLGGDLGDLGVALGVTQARTATIREVTIETQGLGLGINVAFDGKGLSIENITAGVLHSWNAMIADEPIAIGDRIVEVNGVRGDKEKMLEQVKESHVLVLLVQPAAEVAVEKHRENQEHHAALQESEKNRVELVHKYVELKAALDRSSKAQEELAKKCREQQAALEQSAQDREHLAQQCCQQAEAFAHSEKIRLQLTSTTEALEKKVADLQVQVPGLKERLQESEKSKDHQIALRVEAEADAERSEKQLDTLRDTLSSYKIMIQTSEAAATTAKEELASKQAQWKEKYAALNSKLKCSVAAELLQKSEAEVERLQDELILVQADCRRLEASVESLAQESQAAQEECKRLRASANSSSNQFTSVADVMRYVMDDNSPDEKVSICESQREQELEDKVAALELELRSVALKNAQLQSGALDLQDEGKSMRAVLTSQNEALIQKVADMSEEQNAVKASHEKVMTDCADMQGELEDLRCRQKKWASLEGLNRRLEAERQALSEEVERLRLANNSLCTQVFGEEEIDLDEEVQLMRGMKTMDSEGGSAAEDSMLMVLKLRKRLTEREEAHRKELEKFQEFIEASHQKSNTENTDMQAELEDLRSRQKTWSSLEGLNRRLEADRQALAAEVERLRASNTALCAQVFGEEQNLIDLDEEIQLMRGMKTMNSDAGSVTEESMLMVLKLRKRLADQDDAHRKELEKFQEFIEELSKPKPPPAPPEPQGTERVIENLKHISGYLMT